MDMGRPGWVWVLIVFYGYTGFLGLIGALLPGPGAAERVSAVILSLIAIAVFRALLRMDRSVVKLLFAELGVSVVTTAYTVIMDASYRDRFLTTPRLVIVGIGYCISLLVIRYAWRLERRGVLA